MARPRKKIDPLQVEQLAMIGCPNSEIAGILGCDEAILCRRFDRAIRKGQLRRNIALRRKIYELAMRGNFTMLVWLGKLCLAQTDKPPLSESLHHEHEAIGSSSIEQPRERDRKLQREIEVLLKKAGLRANTDPAGGAKAVPPTGAETAGTSYQIIQGNRPSSEGRKPAAAHRHTPKNHAYSRVNNGLRWLEPCQWRKRS